MLVWMQCSRKESNKQLQFCIFNIIKNNVFDFTQEVIHLLYSIFLSSRSRQYLSTRGLKQPNTFSTCFHFGCSKYDNHQCITFNWFPLKLCILYSTYKNKKKECNNNSMNSVQCWFAIMIIMSVTAGIKYTVILNLVIFYNNRIFN